MPILDQSEEYNIPRSHGQQIRPFSKTKVRINKKVLKIAGELREVHICWNTTDFFDMLLDLSVDEMDGMAPILMKHNHPIFHLKNGFLFMQFGEYPTNGHIVPMAITTLICELNQNWVLIDLSQNKAEIIFLKKFVCLLRTSNLPTIIEEKKNIKYVADLAYQIPADFSFEGNNSLASLPIDLSPFR